jgi:hypothetical protein
MTFIRVTIVDAEQSASIECPPAGKIRIVVR